MQINKHKKIDRKRRVAKIKGEEKVLANVKISTKKSRKTKKLFILK